MDVITKSRQEPEKDLANQQQVSENGNCRRGSWLARLEPQATHIPKVISLGFHSPPLAGLVMVPLRTSWLGLRLVSKKQKQKQKKPHKNKTYR